MSTGGAGPDARVACRMLCPTSYSVARTSMAANGGTCQTAERRLVFTGGAGPDVSRVDAAGKKRAASRMDKNVTRLVTQIRIAIQSARWHG